MLVKSPALQSSDSKIDRRKVSGEFETNSPLKDKSPIASYKTMRNEYQEPPEKPPKKEVAMIPVLLPSAFELKNL